MKCEKWEESIYLYEELTVEERFQVDEHIKQCVGCENLLLEQTQLRRVIAGVAGERAELRDPLRTTSKIMKGIEPVTKRVLWFNVALDHVFARYALAACSLVLIAFFIREQIRFEQPEHEPAIISAADAKVVLRSNSFLKVTRRESAQPAGTSNPSLYVCVKTGQCDHPIVKHFKQRKNENI